MILVRQTGQEFGEIGGLLNGKSKEGLFEFKKFLLLVRVPGALALTMKRRVANRQPYSVGDESMRQ